MQARLRRRLGATLAASAAFLGAAGCEQPTPVVTLYSGGTSLYDEAYSYCFDGQDPGVEPGAAGACRYDADREPKKLGVRPGDVVVVDVDREIADSGWYVVLRGAEPNQQVRLATQQEHVTSFQPDFTQSAVITVQVQKLTDTSENAQSIGVWQFELFPE